MPNPFAHIELTTADLGKAKKFYKKLFDWKLTDESMGPGAGVYTMIATGKAPGGGMQTGGAKHKETQPPPWSECFLPWMVGLLRRRDASSVKSPNVGALWIKVKETLVPVQ